LSAGNAATDPAVGAGNTWSGVGGAATDPNTGGYYGATDPAFGIGNTWSGVGGAATDPVVGTGNARPAVPGSIRDEWAQWWKLQQEWMANGRVGPAPASVSGQVATDPGLMGGGRWGRSGGGGRYGTVAEPQNNWNSSGSW
jgi:hypothetical protein